MKSQAINIFIKCDANSRIGSGHLTRCTLLAAKLNSRFNIKFFCKNETIESFSSKLKNFDVIIDQDITSGSHQKILSDKVGILIIDSYDLDASYFDYIRHEYPNLLTLAFDDFQEKFKYNLNGLINFSLSSECYLPPDNMQPFSIWGIDKYPLSQSIIDAQIKKTAINDSLNIGVSMGGSDPELQTERILNLSVSLLQNPQINSLTFILGPSFDNPQKFINRTINNENIKVISNPESIYQVFSSFDLMIIGGGVTTLELAFLGIPQITLSLAPNQLPVVNALKSKEFASHLGYFSEINDSELISKLNNYIENFSNLTYMAKNFQKYVSLNNNENSILSSFEKVITKHILPDRFNLEEVANDYLLPENIDENKIQAFELAKWGSHQSMVNRFKLGAKIIPFSEINTWLDIGCGSGDFLKEVEANYSIGYFMGLDLSPDMLKLARKNIFKTDNLDLKQINFLEYSEKTFDLITSIGVLQKCGTTPFLYFSKIYSLLKKDGYHFFTTKNIDWSDFKNKNLTPFPGHHWFKPEDLEEIIINLGFRIINKGGFLPRENEIVEINESHTLFYLIKKEVHDN